MGRINAASKLGIVFGLAGTLVGTQAFAVNPEDYRGDYDVRVQTVQYRDRDDRPVQHYAGDVVVVNPRTGYLNIVDRSGFGFHVDARHARILINGRRADLDEVGQRDIVAIRGFVPSGALLVADEVNVVRQARDVRVAPDRNWRRDRNNDRPHPWL